MKTKLTQEDIQKLNYQKRPAFLISGLIFILGVAISIMVNYENEEDYTLIMLFVTIVISPSVAYLMMGKYQKDISNKEKILEVKTIQKKESITDYEAGSGKITDVFAKDMKTFDNYSIIIDNTRFRVDKDFYEACNAGDEVSFHIAPKSKHRLTMELNKNKLENTIF